jgi:CheY-like chemotaxis protein
MSRSSHIMIVSDDEAARRHLTDAFRTAGWLSDAKQSPTLTIAVDQLNEVYRDGSKADSAPDCLLIDYRSRYDNVHHAIAAIRRCDAGASLPIVVLTTALQGESTSAQPYTFGVLWIHLMSYDLPSLSSLARALRRILAGRGDIFRRSSWIRDDDLPRLALLIGDDR